jgi:hypothetical protein
MEGRKDERTDGYQEKKERSPTIKERRGEGRKEGKGKGRNA